MPLVPVSCQKCGKLFDARRSDVARGRSKFCSMSCRSIDKVEVKFTCDRCGVKCSIKVWPSQATARTRRFCSLNCSTLALMPTRPAVSVGETCQCRQCGSDLVVTKGMAAGGKRLCKPCKRLHNRAYAMPAEYQREWKKKHPERFTEYQARWLKRNGHKSRAHRMVNRAVRLGHLVKTDCVECGSDQSVHGHHEDYSKPLEVVWLCRACHMKRHRKTA